MHKIGGWDYSNSSPLTQLGAGTHHYNIAMSPDKVINAGNSYLSYKVKFVMNINTANAQYADNKARGLGRYYVKNNFLYYVPLSSTTSGSTTTIDFPAKPDYTKEEALCLFPLNSCCIFDKTYLNIGGTSPQDLRVNRTRSLVQ